MTRRPFVPRVRRVLMAGASALGLAFGAACGDSAPTARETPPQPPTPPVPTSAFERGLPFGWSAIGNGGAAFETGTDAGRAAEPRALTVRAPGASAAGNQFQGFAQSIRADDYRGKRLRFSASVRTQAVGARGARLYMRVDGPPGTPAFDNMEPRPITGTTDWRAYSVVLDVPSDAYGLQLGGFLADVGQAWWDGLRLEVVGPDVPSTSLLAAPQAVPTATLDQLRSAYARAPSGPTNFEISLRGPALDAAAVSWLRGAAVPFAGSDPALPLDDLAPLAAIVGSARLVGLGEGTHGTREHFQTKHRIVQYLVRELGFTAFAIEATWPEANAIDVYVRTGRGDPAVLLSNLYFWTWNTQEVLDLILWMRAYNQQVPAARQVRFFGFDMQFPGAAIDSAAAFVRRVDPARAADVDSAYACLAAYRNHGARAPAARYANTDASYRAACRSALARPHALLTTNAAAYRLASDDETYARAHQSARLVVQWEDMESGGGSLARDRYMAENTDWLLGRLPAGARMALWAHNYHVSNVPGTQGAHLRSRHGAGYRIVGFTFGTGSFSVIESAGGTFRALTTLATDYVAPWSFEAYAAATGLGNFIVDTRRVAAEAPAALRSGVVTMRSIGSVFDPSQPASYFGGVRLAEDYDALVHFARGTASVRLPFRSE